MLIYMSLQLHIYAYFFVYIFKRIFMLIIDSLKINTSPITWMYGYL